MIEFFTSLYNNHEKIASFLWYFFVYKLTSSWYNSIWFILSISLLRILMKGRLQGRVQVWIQSMNANPPSAPRKSSA